MPKQESHKHDYQKLGFIREAGVTNHLVNRIILTRSCACGASYAFECGDKFLMRELYGKLKLREDLKQREGVHGNSAESTSERQTGTNNEDIAFTARTENSEQF